MVEVTLGDDHDDDHEAHHDEQRNPAGGMNGSSSGGGGGRCEEEVDRLSPSRSSSSSPSLMSVSSRSMSSVWSLVERMRNVLRNREAMWAIATYSAHSFAATMANEAFPLWCLASADDYRGHSPGLGLRVGTIGTLMGVSGVVLLLFQVQKTTTTRPLLGYLASTHDFPPSSASVSFFRFLSTYSFSCLSFMLFQATTFHRLAGRYSTVGLFAGFCFFLIPLLLVLVIGSDYLAHDHAGYYDTTTTTTNNNEKGGGGGDGGSSYALNGTALMMNGTATEAADATSNDANVNLLLLVGAVNSLISCGIMGAYTATFLLINESCESSVRAAVNGASQMFASIFKVRTH